MNNWENTISSMFEGDSRNLPEGDIAAFQNKYKIHQRKQAMKRRGIRTFCILVNTAILLLIGYIITTPKIYIDQRRPIAPSIGLVEVKISHPAPIIQTQMLRQEKAIAKQFTPQTKAMECDCRTDSSSNASMQYPDKVPGTSETSRSKKELIEIFTDEVAPNSPQLQVDLLFNNNIISGQSGHIKPQHGENTSEEETSPYKVIEYPSIRIGTRIRFWQQNRWSLSTGIVYSFMRSNTFQNQQLLSNDVSHYIGIPLQVSYHFFEGTYSKLYTNVGCLAQYCIASNIHGIPGYTRSSKFLMSSQIGIGYSHRLGEPIEIYVEPSVELILGKLPVIYKSKGRLSLNLEIGCRFLL